jgi:UDP-3-O-[3-hydroxymyristoyl] glucosamine N-acyltransferase
MADPRFFQVAGRFTIVELAAAAGAEISPDADRDKLYDDVAPLQSAGATELSFLDNPSYLEAFENSRAGACIVQPKFAERAPKGMDLLLAPTPYSAYARVARTFYPPSPPAAAIHETAVVDPTAELGEEVELGPYAVVGPTAEIGPRCRIGAHAVIGAGVVIGAETTIGPGASLSHCLVGNRCQLHAGVRIGNRGFGFTLDPDGYLDVPQLGRVIIGDDVEVGANSTIDRGAGPDTVIGAGSKIDNLVQIGHNVQIGQGCVLVAQSGVAGSTRLENHVVLAAQAGLAGHLTIGQGAQIAAQSGVMRDVPAGQKVFGSPAMPIRDFFRLFTTWQRQLKTQGKKG